MKIEHIALWTNHIEELKAYYTKWFGGVSNKMYQNKETGFKSYFLQFESGSRLEIMKKEAIPNNLNDTVQKQHIGFIHIAFGVSSKEEVDTMANAMREAGHPILRGPRITGDGYYEFETLDPDNNRLEITTVNL